MSESLSLLRRVVSALEEDPTMRKGRLVEAAVRAKGIDWDGIFDSLRLRGRHRRRLRWRRSLVTSMLRRVYRRGSAVPLHLHAPAAAQAPTAPTAPAAPQAPQLQVGSFAPEAVWRRFREVFPVLCLGRRLASAAPPAPPTAARGTAGGAA